MTTIEIYRAPDRMQDPSKPVREFRVSTCDTPEEVFGNSDVPAFGSEWKLPGHKYVAESVNVSEIQEKPGHWTVKVQYREVAP